MKGRKSCWTCKGEPLTPRAPESVQKPGDCANSALIGLARKLQCDGRQPTCERCTRAQRDCQGYQPRLSWPRDNDRKRALVGKDGLLVAAEYTGEKGPAGRFFINTTRQDLEQYHLFSLHAQAVRHESLYRPSSPGSWGHSKQETGHLELFRHCKLAPAYQPPTHISVRQSVTHP